MKATFTWMAGGAFLALTAVSAQADCAAELARLTEGGAASEGISKDGSLAPLEEASDAAAGTDAGTTDAAETAGMDAGATDAAETTESAGMDAGATDAAETAEAAGMHSAAPTAGTDTAAMDSTAAEGSEGIAKDGSHTPLEDASGQQPGVAMSGADAEAQQEGQPTAAEQATAASDAAGTTADQSTRDAHIQAARDALAAGDEEACMKAVQAAQSS